MIRENPERRQGSKKQRKNFNSVFLLSSAMDFASRVFRPRNHMPRLLADYCSKVIVDGLGQQRDSVVIPAANPAARRVQHSPSVEE